MDGIRERAEQDGAGSGIECIVPTEQVDHGMSAIRTTRSDERLFLYLGRRNLRISTWSNNPVCRPTGNQHEITRLHIQQHIGNLQLAFPFQEYMELRFKDLPLAHVHPGGCAQQATFVERRSDFCQAKEMTYRIHRVCLSEVETVSRVAILPAVEPRTLGASGPADGRAGPAVRVGAVVDRCSCPSAPRADRTRAGRRAHCVTTLVQVLRTSAQGGIYR